MKTRKVDKQKCVNYLKKAGEFFESMNECYSNKRWNASVLNAVHCAISSADALTVFFIGERHAGERHEDVITLLNSLNLQDMQAKNRQLIALLRIKNSAEYEETLMSEKDAADALRDAERFHKWVRGLLRK